MNDPTPRSDPPRKNLRRIGIRLAISLAVFYVLLEVALRQFPEVLPPSYRESYPLHGVELALPGILDEVPIDELPLPVMVIAHTGTPPADLVERGIAPSGIEEDRRRFPRFTTPADELGLPNEERPEQADIVLVGDSFLVWAGVTDPPGLTARLGEATGRSVYNTGISGIGPIHGEWILREVGLELQPELVIWFFFGGNDMTDTWVTLEYMKKGYETHADLFGDRRPPFLRVPDLVSFLLRDTPERSEPLPPFLGPVGAERMRSDWFLGSYLSQLVIPKEQWLNQEATKVALDVLARARDEVNAAGAGFLLVYLPSKAQVHLPLAVPDPELLHLAGARGSAGLSPLAPEEFLARALANHGALEEVIEEFCREREIAYFSATPILVEMARRGESGFVTADTHWSPVGQEAVLGPLLELLEEEGLLE